MGTSNMQLETGNLTSFGPYTMRAVSGVLAAATLPVGGPAAENDLFALRNVSQGDTAGLYTKPLAVSRIRTRFVATDVAALAQLALRVDKVINFSATHTTNRTSVLARNRKTSGYPVVPVTEIAGVVATTTVMATATYSQYDTDEPFDLLLAANVAANGVIVAESEWFPKDRLPLVLEANEGIVIGLDQTFAFAGTARLFVAVDFAR